MTQNKFFYKGYWVYVTPNGTCFTALIYKGATCVSGCFAHPIEGEPEQIVVGKAMNKIDQLAA